MRAILIRQVLWLMGLAFLPAIGQALYYRGNAAWEQPPVDAAQVTVGQAKIGAPQFCGSMPGRMSSSPAPMSPAQCS